MSTQTIKAASVPVRIPVNRLIDLLIGAFEGGSNYWIDEVQIVYPPGVTTASGREMLRVAGREMGLNDYIVENNPLYVAPFVDGCGIEIVEQEKGSKQPKLLTLESIEAGLQIMASGNLSFHFSDIIGENDDATTVQLAVFGELVYG